jgi:hypothetical protein
MKQLLISATLITVMAASAELRAQTDLDAIRYSHFNPSATARSLSMGGAFGALGADFSVLSGNPAGLGLYRKSEFTFTPSFGSNVTDATFFGKTATDTKFNFSMGNLGLVYAFPKDNESSPWKGWAFAIGYNRLNNLHSRSLYEAVNTQSSLLNSFVETANGTNYQNLNEFYENLAFQTYLIDTLPFASSQYFSAIPQGGALQRGAKETRGSLGDISFAFGGNYENRIFWGFAVGIPYLRYSEDYLYEEIDEKNTINQTTPGIDSAYAAVYNFKSFSLTQNLRTTGTGVNVKFGLIFRPNDMIRFGAAIHSPTYYSMHDEYASSMSAKFEIGQLPPSDSPVGMYDYNLTTPFRALFSMAALFQQQGILSLDYELTDYSSARLSADDYGFTQENTITRTTYTQAHTLRAGAEWKYGIFAFRAGAGYRTGIFKSGLADSKSDQHQITYSAGFGIREESYFVDFGYSLANGNYFYRPYELASTPESEPGVFFKTREHKLLVTIGFRF